MNENGGAKVLLLVAQPTKRHAVLDTASPCEEIAGYSKLSLLPRNDAIGILNN